MEKLIGREEEKKLFLEALKSKAPELIAVYGRRRVGKTFLVRQVLQKEIVFEFIGTKEANLGQQLANFSKVLGKAVANEKLYSVPDNWPDAFDLLTHHVTPKLQTGKAIIFLDEFPWINTHKSGFLSAFDHWWNSWGTKQNNLIVIICGSAAAWMIQHIVNNKGGLHNRITRKIRLLPFTLQETEAYLKEQNVKLDRYQILQLYMVMGGIPHYLKEIRKGESSAQAIDRLCFGKDGLLQNEFKNLYHSLFDDATRHLAVIKALAKNNSGLTRNEIINAAEVSSGGRITELLDELLESGFITTWLPYDKKSKEAIYKLADEYSHFYIRFVEHSRSRGNGTWLKFSNGQSWKSWSGVAFERVCLKHIAQLKKVLGISVVYTEESAWRYVPKSGTGAQIDLLIDRRDFVIHICEMKYSESLFAIDKKYAGELENKMDVFRRHTKTKKSLFITMVTTFGIKNNEYASRLVQNSITMDALFEV
jgi:AAA+ ATPase superfamily predicted ATPase